jgi:hypothetical protein
MPQATPAPSKGVRIVPTALPAIAEGVIQVGAQFHDGNESSNPASVGKASGPTANIPKPKGIYSSRKVLERYLKTAERTEILLLGRQSCRMSRAFDNHLITKIDGILTQVEASDMKNMLLPN